MNSPLLVLSFLLAIEAHALTVTSVDDLAFACTAEATVEKVLQTHYSPGQPPRGRSNGYPPSGSVVVEASLKHMSAGCQTLTTKYGVDTNAKIQVSVGLPYEPSGKSDVEQVAAVLPGLNLKIETTQNFGYTHQGPVGPAYLPLHPQIVSETLSYKGAVQIASTSYPAHAAIAFSIEKVYKTTPLDKQTDAQKLELSNKLIYFLKDIGKASSLSDFASLFLDLEFKSAAAQKTHYFHIVKLFKKAAQNPSTHFFEFQTGGDGYFVGSHFAQKAITLANLTATPQEKVQLAIDYPTIFIPGYVFSENDFNSKCLVLTPGEFGQVLTTWQNSIPSLLTEQLYKVKGMVSGFASSNLANYACMKKFKTAENLKIAYEILKSL